MTLNRITMDYNRNNSPLEVDSPTSELTGGAGSRK